MGLFSRLFQKSQTNSPQGAAITPAPQGQPPTTTSPGGLQPQRPKTLTELERELEAQPLKAYPIRHSAHARKPLLKRLIGLTLLVGVPVGIIWFVNLPYPPIRRPIARTAPILLLPSYMSMDQNYRDALTLVQQADQLISNPTSAADLDLGGEKLQRAKESLDALPIWFLYDFPEYRTWWYYWRFNPLQFDAARARAGELEAILFQETNAQLALTQAEQALNAARTQYQQATTSLDKDQAIATWRQALNDFTLIPGQTLAGRTAQQQLVAYTQEFQETVGLAAGNEQVASVIESARDFAWQASKLAENPPHSVAKWEQIISLWKEAIARLETISPNDPVAYREAQKMLATYQANLAQINVRLQEEASAEQLFQSAQQDIERLIANSPTTMTPAARNQMLSQLQGIINSLERIDDGTTVYNEAQQLLIQANAKLHQLQP
jgi:hypothetical protein